MVNSSKLNTPLICTKDLHSHHATLINHLSNQDKTHADQHGFDDFTALEMNHFGAVVAAYPLAYGHDETYLPDYMPTYDEGDDGGAISKE